MSNTKSVEWVNGTTIGFAGRCACVVIRESIPMVSWKCTVEALEQIPGSSYLRRTGRKLSENGPTLDAARALAPMLVNRLLAEAEAA